MKNLQWYLGLEMLKFTSNKFFKCTSAISAFSCLYHSLKTVVMATSLLYSGKFCSQETVTQDNSAAILATVSQCSCIHKNNKISRSISSLFQQLPEHIKQLCASLNFVKYLSRCLITICIVV